MSDPLINGGYQPLQTPLPAYPYAQYADDDTIAAFFDAYNDLAQSYLDWFNETPLGVYTSPSISGELLDWVAEGVYGIVRPVIATQTTTSFGSFNSFPFNTLAFNEFFKQTSGTSVIATDDLYKRALTWHMFLGDGRQMSLQWLRRRIARFLYGSNGSDFDVGLLPNISITQGYTAPVGPFATAPFNTIPFNDFAKSTTYARGILDITLPDVPAALPLIAFMEQGILALPFQVSLQIQITSMAGYVAFIPAGSSGYLTSAGEPFLVRP